MNNRRSLQLLAEAYKRVYAEDSNDKTAPWQERDFLGHADLNQADNFYNFVIIGKKMVDSIASDIKSGTLPAPKGVTFKRDTPEKAYLSLELDKNLLNYQRLTLQKLNDMEEKNYNAAPEEGFIFSIATTPAAKGGLAGPAKGFRYGGDAFKFPKPPKTPGLGATIRKQFNRLNGNPGFPGWKIKPDE